MQDLAGARIAVSDLINQDKAVEDIKREFGTSAHPTRLYDRRENPSHGYRAVHVIVFQEGAPIEVQVRTDLQDAWAQIMERLADQWGREIRYGGRPDGSGLPVGGSVTATRSEAVARLIRLSDEVAEIEVRRRGLTGIQAQLEEVGRPLTEIKGLADGKEPAREEVVSELRSVQLIGLAATPELPDAPTNGQVLEYVQTLVQEFGALLSARLVDLDSAEEQLRGTLQLMADAASD